MIPDTAASHMKTIGGKKMADTMINKTTPHNKSAGTPGIGETVSTMNEYDMNVLNDTIGKKSKS